MKHMLDDLGESTKYLVVISKKTGLMRRVILTSGTDNDYEEHLKTLHHGEKAIFVPHDQWEKFQHADEMLDHVAKKAGHKGKPHHDVHKYAVVNENDMVVNIIIADPSCGDKGLFHGHRMHHNPTAYIGQKISGGYKKGI